MCATHGIHCTAPICKQNMCSGQYLYKCMRKNGGNIIIALFIDEKKKYMKKEPRAVGVSCVRGSQFVLLCMSVQLYFLFVCELNTEAEELFA